MRPISCIRCSSTNIVLVEDSFERKAPVFSFKAPFMQVQDEPRYVCLDCGEKLFEVD